MGLFDRLKKVTAAAAEVKESPAPAPMSEEQRLTVKANGGDVAAMIELAERCKFGTAEEGENGEKAVYWYTKAAEAGDADAMYELGNLYCLGTAGVAEDRDKMMAWYAKAAEAGQVDAMYDLAMEYRYDDEDDEVIPDAAKAVSLFAQAADKGKVEAIVELATMVEEGLGVEANPAQAAEMYKQACRSGSCEAQYRLGMLYKEGRGVTKDYEIAFSLFHDAALQGDGWAMMELALAYGQGRGTLPDPALAYRWAKEQVSGEDDEEGLALLAAMDKGMADVRVDDMNALVAKANGGDGKACYRLGFLYEAGVDVEHDGKKAFHWYTKALENDHEGAIYRLARLYHRGEGVEQDLKFAIKLYGEASNRGEWDATYVLGEMCLEQGSKKDAAGMFTIAAKRDHARSQYKLAELYLLGEGVEKDVPLGIEWLQKAAANGCPDAMPLVQALNK